MPDIAQPPTAETGAPPPTAAAPAAAAPIAQKRRPRDVFVRLAVLVAAGIIVVLFATQWDRWTGGGIRQVTDDAYIRGDVTPLSAKVEGYVHRVAVDDFQRVQAGDLLVEIDDSDYRAKVAQAEADVLGAQAAIENIKAHKATQHAQVTEAESVVAATQADVERTR